MNRRHLERQHLAFAAAVFLLCAAALLILGFPLLAFGQEAATAVGDDLGQLLGLVVNGVKGGDWQAAVLAGILLVVWVVRKIAVRIPKVGAFLATDEGGAALLVLTGVPVALLAAKAGGAALTAGLVGKALIATLGAGGGWTVGRKLLRLVSPLVANIPKVGPALAGVVDLLSGAKAKAEIAAATAAAYKAQAVADAQAGADALSQPPVR